MANAFLKLRQVVEHTRLERRLETGSEAFVHLCLQVILKLSDAQIESAVVTGEDDGGVNAIHIDDDGVHIVVCDYVESRREAERAFPRARIDQFTQTWLHIVCSETEQSAVNAALWKKIGEVKRYWNQVEGTYIPETFYFLTNRMTPPTGRAEIERQLDHYMTNTYCYIGQEALLLKMSMRN